MNLAGCVVLFNPKKDIVKNIQTYLPFLGELIVVDNSTIPNPFVEKIASMDKVIYIAMKGNKGIAAALNEGCHRAIEDKYDVILTMDQDSRFPLELSNEILRRVDYLLNEYALVGLNYNTSDLTYADEISEPKYWLTSGNFVSLKAYKKVGGFNDSLFIDYVDIEFDYKLYKYGMKICYLNNYSIKHEIGSPIRINFGKKIFYAMNHAPIRYYYRYRNSEYLFKLDKSFFCKKFFGEIFINVPKMLLFEPRKWEKLKMICHGLFDGARGILGPIRKDECDDK